MLDRSQRSLHRLASCPSVIITQWLIDQLKASRISRFRAEISIRTVNHRPIVRAETVSASVSQHICRKNGNKEQQVNSGVALLQPCPLLSFNSSLPACHNINLSVASCTVVIFPLSYRVLYRVDGAEIKDITDTTTWGKNMKNLYNICFMNW